MTQQLLRLLTAVILPAALCFAGCAGMNNTFDGIKKNIADLRREKPPIATSLKQMPEDARAITCAIYKNITMVHHDGDLMPVNFTGTAMSQFSSDQKVLQNFTLTGAHLYEHEPSHIKGALFLEDAVGRRSSLSYDATYQRTGENIIIDTIELTPIYSPDANPFCWSSRPIGFHPTPPICRRHTPVCFNSPRSGPLIRRSLKTASTAFGNTW